MENYIEVTENPPELLKAVPGTGKYRVMHVSPQGRNFCLDGDNKNDLVTRCTTMAEIHGFKIEGVEGA